jgi:hypothetical protein
MSLDKLRELENHDPPLSFLDMGKLIGCSATTVARWFRELGVEHNQRKVRSYANRRIKPSEVWDALWRPKLKYFGLWDRKSLPLRLRAQVIQRLGGKCARCGFNEDWRALEVDHKNGDGSSERSRSTQIFRIILRLPLEEVQMRYQLLCCSCNKIMNYERGVWGSRWIHEEPF